MHCVVRRQQPEAQAPAICPVKLQTEAMIGTRNECTRSRSSGISAAALGISRRTSKTMQAADRPSRAPPCHGFDALAAMGLVRNAAVVVPSFSTALSIAAETDLVALIPSSYFEHLRARGTLCSFALPMPTEQITVSQMWHPRLDRDPGHRWLRGIVFEVCRPAGNH